MIREANPTETAATKNGRTKLSPKELAAQWGVSRKTILRLIRTGELPAIDASPNPGKGGRTCLLIDLADIAIFEERRAVRPPAPRAPRAPQRRTKKTKDDGITKFF
jgi:transposase